MSKEEIKQLSNEELECISTSVGYDYLDTEGEDVVVKTYYDDWRILDQRREETPWFTKEDFVIAKQYRYALLDLFDHEYDEENYNRPTDVDVATYYLIKRALQDSHGPYDTQERVCYRGYIETINLGKEYIKRCQEMMLEHQLEEPKPSYEIEIPEYVVYAFVPRLHMMSSLTNRQGSKWIKKAEYLSKRIV